MDTVESSKSSKSSKLLQLVAGQVVRCQGYFRKFVLEGVDYLHEGEVNLDDSVLLAPVCDDTETGRPRQESFWVKRRELIVIPGFQPPSCPVK